MIPLISAPHDPSFPSDHATAAFAIAFGILFVAFRVGRVFLGWALLIALSRVLVGVHYPTDVLASLLVGVGAGFVCARLLMAPVLEPLIRLVGRLTDPILEPIEHSTLVRSTLGSERFRSVSVAIVGAVLLLVFAWRLEGPLLDDMPLAAMALWVSVVAGAVYVARMQPHNRRHVSS